MAAAAATPTEQQRKPAVLTVVNPSGYRSRISISENPFLIGRQSDNHLVLRDNRVSRNHARIVYEDGVYYLEDLTSRHGTFLNGGQVKERVKLNSADMIGFGFTDSYHLVFSQDEAELARLMEQVASTTTGGPIASSSATGGSMRKLRALVEVARALQGQLSVDEVLDAVVDASLAVTGTQRGFLLIQDKDDLAVRVARDSSWNRLSKDDLKVPTRLIHRALKQRRELLSMNFDPRGESGGLTDVSVMNLELRSIVCVPLVRVRTEMTPDTLHAALNETVGMLYLDSRLDLGDAASGNREILQTLALEASTVLENARLLQEQRAKQRLEEELAIARKIQQDLLPRELPRTGWFRMAGSSVSSAQVAGDYYDVARIHDRCWSVVIADVSGKGVSSGLLASFLQGAFQLGSETPAQIQAMLQRVNAFLYERTGGEKYATLFYGALNLDGNLCWTNAGHCAPIVLQRNGAMQTLSTTGMPVGILDQGSFEVKMTRLQPGDKIVLFSDGLTEAQNPGGQFFDMERIRSVLRSCADLNCELLHNSLKKAVTNFISGAPQRDDMTLVVVEYAPEAHA